MAELSIDSDAAVFIDLEGCLIESWFDRTIIPELKPVIDKLPNIKLFTFAIFSDEDMSWEVFSTGRDSIQFEKGDGDNYEEIEIKG